MRMIKKLLLAGLLALAMSPVFASPIVHLSDDEITPDVNRLVVVEACDRVLSMQLSIFDGPAESQGKVLIYTIPKGMDAHSSKLLFKELFVMILKSYSPRIAVLKLEDTGGWQCA